MSVDDLMRRILLRDPAGIQAWLNARPDDVNRFDDNDYTPLHFALIQRPVCIACLRILLEAGASVNPIRPQASKRPTYYSGSTALALSEAAVESGSMEACELLQAHGLDFTDTSSRESHALLTAASDPELLPVLKWMLSLGCDPNYQSKYRETAITSALLHSSQEAVEALLSAGADPGIEGWSEAHMAAYFNQPDRIQELVSRGEDIDAFSSRIECTPLHFALRRGHEAAAKELLELGAKREAGYESLIESAALGGSVQCLQLIIKAGLEENRIPPQMDIAEILTDMNAELKQELSESGLDFDDDMLSFLKTSAEDEGERAGSLDSALAVAAHRGDLNMARRLLALGASPTAETHGESALTAASNRAMALLLLDAGADPGGITSEAARRIAGIELSESQGYEALLRLDSAALQQAPPKAELSPTDGTTPYRQIMIRTGLIAYHARSTLGMLPAMACPSARPDPAGYRTEGPAWCASRYGQSATFLPDNRMILIGGEHEDYYDPDFCIYNDIFMINEQGEITIFDYPESAFPPTDFHTATLIGDHIWIIGGLGYKELRLPECPIFRLNTKSWNIERLAGSGDAPPRLYSHRATITPSGEIRVWSGTWVPFSKPSLLRRGKELDHKKNEQAWLLDREKLVWRVDDSLAD